MYCRKFDPITDLDEYYRDEIDDDLLEGEEDEDEEIEEDED